MHFAQRIALCIDCACCELARSHALHAKLACTSERSDDSVQLYVATFAFFQILIDCMQNVSVHCNNQRFCAIVHACIKLAIQMHATLLHAQQINCMQ